MWDKPEVHTGAVMKQERSLAQEFWAGYGKNGSRVERFRRPQQSIWDILEPVIGKKPSQADSYSTPRIQGLPRVLANFFSSKPDSMNARNVCRVLLLEILQHPQKIAQFCDLLGDDAQLLLNLSSQLLRERSSFQAADWTALLSLSCKLAMSAQLYPQSFTLNGVSYNPKRPSVGQGGFAFVHKGTYKNKPVCLKVPREPGVESLAVHLKELFLWARLTHRSILPFYGASTFIDKKLCLVAPWIEGGNLCDFAASHPQEERWPLALSCQPPYHQYSDTQAATIIITRREVPQRPMDGDSNHMIGEETWGHLLSCWAFDPAGRPECAALAEALRDLNRTSLPSPSTDNQATHSLSPDSGQKSKVRIDFERAVNLLREVSRVDPTP
ncbi:hypothetical protein AN958_09198 [Leucoagaricus sp. SymC.cos]|nr:hypothetical protein AN958_09198 [Leucoagaricus sp. SymC.cos]